MDKNDKSELVKVLVKLTRIEEKVLQGFKHSSMDLKEIKEHITIINDEMGTLRDRVGGVEKLYIEAKARYDRISLYWKVVSFVLSPVVTFGVIMAVKYILGLPIP